MHQRSVHFEGDFHRVVPISNAAIICAKGGELKRIQGQDALGGVAKSDYASVETDGLGGNHVGLHDSSRIFNQLLLPGA